MLVYFNLRNWGSILPLLLFLITGLVTIFDVGAQDISKLKDEKPFTISGGVGMSSSTYWSNQKYKVRDPFAWSFNANLTPTIYGFSFPFTAVVTQYTQSYSAPFTQLGISPTYKWISVHLGYRSMNLSPLVYSGNTFLGVGVELKPKYVQFAAFNGRLNKSISIDTTIDQRIQPQYSRSGQGFKLGFGNESQSFSLQYFHAKDDEGSVFVKKDSLNQLTPQENSVLGGSWKFTFFKKLYFTGDVAASLLSHDIRFNSIEGIGDIKIPSVSS